MLSYWNDSVTWLSAQPSEWVWALYLKGLAIVYCWATLIIARQVRTISSSNGIMPIQARLDRMKADFAVPFRYMYFPSYLHIYSADWFLSALLWTSGIVGPLLIWSGVASRLGFFILWSVYLSYASLLNWMYPWDSLILEMGFLSLFFPTIMPFTTTLSSPCPPLLAFSVRLLVFRLMMGFGKFKFIGMKLTDLSYLQGFLINQPLPTVLGWLMHQLPLPVHIASYFFLFFVEIPGPFLYFICGGPRLLGCILVILLQIGINLTGTFGFFNLLTTALSVGLLDLNSSLFDDFVWQREMGDWASFSRNMALCFLLCLHLIYFPFNSWCTSAFVYWPALNFPMGLIGKFLRLIHPFRISNAYGVFFPHSSPALKWIPLIEGTDEEIVDEDVSVEEQKLQEKKGAVRQEHASWQTYTYKYIISDPYLTPRFVAPYHPRFEHAILYESMGLGPQTMLTPVTTGDPYEFQRRHMLETVCFGLLRENRPVEELFRAVPFGALSQGKKRVKALRVSMYLYRPTSISTLLKTGRWYDRWYSHQHVPLITLDAMEKQRTGIVRLREPEMFHPEHIIWTLRSTAATNLVSKLNSTSSSDLSSKLVAHTAAEAKMYNSTQRPALTPVYAFSSALLSEKSVDAFWTQFVGPLQPTLSKLRFPSNFLLFDQQNGSRKVGLSTEVLSMSRNAGFRVDKPWNEKDPSEWSRIMLEVNRSALWRNLNEEQKYEHEKVCARLTLLMLMRLLPYYHGPDAGEPTRTVWSDMHGETPVSLGRLNCPDGSHLHLPSFFHFYLFCHHIIAHGQEAYDQVLKHPSTAVKYLSTYCLESALFFFGAFFHIDTLAYQSRKRRLIGLFSHPSAMQAGGPLPGFLSIYYHFLLTQFKPSENDAAGKESYPEELKPPTNWTEGWISTIKNMPTHSPQRVVTSAQDKKMN